MELKPDIAAPGVSILSSVVNSTTGAVETPHFNLVTGTSMAAPHVTALAALTEARHPGWTPAEIKSALMNTAQTRMSLDVEGRTPALAKHRGAGRVNAARLVDPQLTFAPASVSFGLLRPGETQTDDDHRHGHARAGSERPLRGRRAPDRRQPEASDSSRRRRSRRSRAAARSSSCASRPPAPRPATTRASSRSPAAGRPTRSRTSCASRIRPSRKDVLLIDWDRNLGGRDHRSAYTAALTGLGLSFDVFDGGRVGGGERQSRTDVRAVAELPRGRALHRRQHRELVDRPCRRLVPAAGLPHRRRQARHDRAGPQLAARVEPEHRQRLPR